MTAPYAIKEEQDRQYTYSMSRVRATIVIFEKVSVLYNLSVYM
jgi:hypothetical protein